MLNMGRLPAYLLAFCLTANAVGQTAGELPETHAFIDQMSSQHGFDRAYLRQVFAQTEIQDNILAAIAKPAESKPWYAYRKIFLTDERIDQGVEFWRKHRATATDVERRYGVPAAVLIAILGVETKYGAIRGNYRVIDALSTLAFAYLRRAKFFRSELEHFLLLCRDERLNPLLPRGSYAGAMGYPQFMPSSFRHFATDYDHDGHRDLWSNPADSIASIANYLVRNGWQPGQPIAAPATVAAGAAVTAADKKPAKPTLAIAEWQRRGVRADTALPTTSKAALYALEGEQQREYWLGLQNFYAITRYNTSPLYAMAVYQLADAIEQRNRTNGTTAGQRTPVR